MLQPKLYFIHLDLLKHLFLCLRPMQGFTGLLGLLK